MKHLPGVDSAGFVTTLPFSHFQMMISEAFAILGAEQAKHPSTQISAVSSDYFRAMQIPVLVGRSIQESDRLGMPLTVVANQAFVRKYLQGGAALGKQLEFDKDSGFTQPLTIVGVVGDSMQGRDLTGTTEPMLYMSYQQFLVTPELAKYVLGIAPSFVVRSSLAQDALNNQLRNAVKNAAPGFSIMELNPMKSDLEGTLNSRKLALRLAMSFGCVALLLAAIGIYGSQAYVVAQSTKEIGIRMALGSSRQAAAMVIFRQAMFLAVCGLGFGVAAALLSGRWIKSLLFGVPPQDPVTVALVVLLISIASALATLIPAYRAASTNPIQALRSE
jgi:ABC-type antimicrobial peptide transport system permease subunit